MQHQLNCHYHPGLCNTPGTYRINCGSVFYIGSSVRMGQRHCNHRKMLEQGTHQNKKLQGAYTATGHYVFTALTEIPKLDADQGADHRDRLRAAEQLLLDAHAGDPCLANASTSSIHNSNIAEVTAARWRDPEFREKQVKRLKARRGDAVLPKTRKLMSEAKKGKRNHKSTPCFTTFNGETLFFESVNQAATHHGVNQQAMDLWMRGKVAWPGTGRLPAKIKRLIGLKGGLI
jgi:hypothetical protein